MRTIHAFKANLDYLARSCLKEKNVGEEEEEKEDKEENKEEEAISSHLQSQDSGG